LIIKVSASLYITNIAIFIIVIRHRNLTIFALILLGIDRLLRFIRIIRFSRRILFNSKGSTIGKNFRSLFTFVTRMVVTCPIDTSAHDVLFIDLKNSIKGRLINITTDIRLQVEKNLRKRKHIVFLEIFQNRV